MTQRRWLITAGATLSLALIGSLSAWRLLSAPSQAANPAAYYRSLAEPKFKAAGPFFSFSDSTREAFLQSFGQASHSISPQARDIFSSPESAATMADKLRTFVLELLHQRFSGEGPEAYKAWREAHGDRFVTAEDYERVNYRSLQIKAQKLGYTQSLPDHTDARALFTMAWNDPQWPRITGLCADPEWCHVRLGSATESRGAFFSDLDTASVDPDLWAGALSITLDRWFINSPDLTQIIQRDGRVVTGIVAVLSEDTTGRRRPMILYCFWDPVAEAWRLRGVSFANDTDESFSRFFFVI